MLASSLLAITACGGGGGSDSNPSVTPTPLPAPITSIEKIQDASNYTSSELQSAAVSIANEDYAGSNVSP